MNRVIIESPFAGDVQVNVAYAQAALRDSLFRGEAPIASHLLYTQVLDDLSPEQRRVGVDAGLAWMNAAFAVVLYTDLGISPGMKASAEFADSLGVPVISRSIGSWTKQNPVATIGGAVPFGYVREARDAES